MLDRAYRRSGSRRASGKEIVISTHTIKNWLENWQALITESRFEDSIPGHKGPKNYDGVTAGRLNTIMLKAAIKSLPVDQRNLIVSKYIRQHNIKETTDLLGLNRQRYETIHKKALRGIWLNVNFGPGKADKPQAKGETAKRTP